MSATCSHRKVATKILVVIASYGNANDRFLTRVLEEYRSMSYSCDIVVLSNIEKKLGSDVQVNVGLPNKNPWSLPFAHKQLFAERVNDYDLFIYSEDDMLITEKNVEAFLQATAILPADKIAGFLRFEKTPAGGKSYPDVHLGYHWDVQSVGTHGEYIYAFFTNEHAASYLLTRSQLQRALASRGFLVEPHEGKYDLLCAAATDPYTQCGFEKVICVSHMNDFEIHHLPNKYVGRLGLAEDQFCAQIQEVIRIARHGGQHTPMLTTKAQSALSHFAKNYYEPVRADLIGLIASNERTVLSIGCGWGATEEQLMRAGKQVTAIALDSVISACARKRGVKALAGDFSTVLSELSGQTFDCVLLSNILHLIAEPTHFLQALGPHMSSTTRVISSVPNLSRAPVRWRSYFGNTAQRTLGDFRRSGVHVTSRQTMRQWLHRAGLRVDQLVDIVPNRMAKLCQASGGILSPLFSSEIVAIATVANEYYTLHSQGMSRKNLV